ncbi:MAG: hypothetical protein IPF64_17375 [Flavobacteriales bacterium]|nr:hypothetical protein [Flavobacteriales bacterium]
MARVLFLRVDRSAVDSVAAMRRDVELLFRQRPELLLKPYDPLLIEFPQPRDAVFTTYQQLFGSREAGPGLLRKDHGRFRAGFLGGVVTPQLEVTTDRTVFAEDGPFSLDATVGWNAGAIVECDVFPTGPSAQGRDHMGSDTRQRTKPYSIPRTSSSMIST